MSDNQDEFEIPRFPFTNEERPPWLEGERFPWEEEEAAEREVTPMPSFPWLEEGDDA